MKIFDWLHRSLHTNSEYCRVHLQGKDSSTVRTDACVDDGRSTVHHGFRSAEIEKEALLEGLHHVTSIHHVLDGILTIGTLGHLDGRCHQDEALAAAASEQELHSNTLFYRKGDHEGEEEEEEEKPVELVASSDHKNNGLTIESFRRELALEGDVVKINGAVQLVAVEEENLFEPLLKAISDEKKARVTLADLLAADHKAGPTGRAASASAKSALGMTVNGATETTVFGASLTCTAERSRGLNKKLVPPKKGKECSPPTTKKLHQRIRRMLKKKIHPEVARDVEAATMTVAPMSPSF